MYFDADEPCIGIVNVVILKTCGVAAGVSVEHLVPVAGGSGSGVDRELRDTGVAPGPGDSNVVDPVHRTEVEVDVAVVALAGPTGAEVAVNYVLGRKVLV